MVSPARLDELTPDAQVRGPNRSWFATARATSIARSCFRSNEPELELVAAGKKWSFAGSGDLFRLVSEAERIRLAYLFDPYVAMSSSAIDPLPRGRSPAERRQ